MLVYVYIYTYLIIYIYIYTLPLSICVPLLILAQELFSCAIMVRILLNNDWNVQYKTNSILKLTILKRALKCTILKHTICKKPNSLEKVLHVFLNGLCHETFPSPFFHQTTSPGPNTVDTTRKFLKYNLSNTL
jgi:hypothetical protein